MQTCTFRPPPLIQPLILSILCKDFLCCNVCVTTRLDTPNVLSETS